MNFLNMNKNPRKGNEVNIKMYITHACDNNDENYIILHTIESSKIFTHL